MHITSSNSKTNPVLITLITILSLTAIYENGFRHEVVYYSYFITTPVALYYLLRGKSGNHFSFLFHLPLFLFIFFSGISLFWSININETLSELYKIIFYVILYYLAAVHITSQDVNKLIKAMLLLGSAIAFIGILLYLFVQSSRITSVFINANPFGIYLAMLSLLSFGIYGNQSNNKWLALVIVIITDALILTGSRGSLIVYGLAFPVLFLSLPHHNRGESLKKIIFLFIIIGITINMISFLAPTIQNMGLKFDTLESLDRLVIRDASMGSSSVVGRLSFWHVAWHMIQERPFTGFGLGSYHIAYNSFRNMDHWWSMYTHNHYLQTWAETGFFALAAFVIFFLLFFINGFLKAYSVKNQGSYWGIYAAGLAFLMHLVIDFSWNMPAVTMLFWVFLGCMVSLQNEERLSFMGEKKKIKGIMGGLVVCVLLLGSIQQFVAFKWIQQGMLDEVDGKYHKAKTKYEWGIKLYPYRTEYFGKLAEVNAALYKLEDNTAYLEKTIELEKKAINLSPYDYYPYQVLGRIMWQEEMVEAEGYFKKAVELGGFKPDPFNDLGYYYLSQGNPRLGIPVFLAGVEQIPFAYKNAPGKDAKLRVNQEGIKLHLGLAKAYKDIGEKEKVLEHFNLVLEIDPENSVARREVEKNEVSH